MFYFPEIPLTIPQLILNIWMPLDESIRPTLGHPMTFSIFFERPDHLFPDDSMWQSEIEIFVQEFIDPFGLFLARYFV